MDKLVSSSPIPSIISSLDGGHVRTVIDQQDRKQNDWFQRPLLYNVQEDAGCSVQRDYLDDRPWVQASFATRGQNATFSGRKVPELQDLKIQATPLINPSSRAARQRRRMVNMNEIWRSFV